MHEKIAFKAMSNTRKDSWGLAKKKNILVQIQGMVR